MIELLIAAESLDDQERMRIALENRVRDMIDTKGLIPRPFWDNALGAAKAAEHQMTLELQRELRKLPLHPWIKGTIGIGEKQSARLLAAIGDPSVRPERDEDGELTGEMVPRTVGQLWAYCGFHVVNGAAPKRRKGVQGNWNETARMRARLIAESAQKSGVRQIDGCDDDEGYDLDHRVAITPYGQVYLDSRSQDADLDSTNLHKHNRALRKVAKTILKDMWIESNKLTDSHVRAETHPGGAIGPATSSFLAWALISRSC